MRAKHPALRLSLAGMVGILLFIAAFPPANGQPLSATLDGLRAMVALGATSLCPDHGGPVGGEPEKIRHMVTSSADFLDALVARTLAALDDGSPPHVDIVRRVEIPPHDLPWLRPLYDEAEFIIRNVIRYYGGWWTGRPSELKPAPRDAVAREVAALAGGARARGTRGADLRER